MRDGAVVAEGAPAEIVTEQLIESVFGLSCVIVPDPVTGTPMIVPRGRHAIRVDTGAAVAVSAIDKKETP